MKKKVEDVVPKKSIRDIDIPKRGRDLESKDDIKRSPKYSPKNEDPFVRPVSINQSVNNHTPMEDEPIKIESIPHHPIKPPVPPTTDFKYEYREAGGRKSGKKKYVYLVGVLVLAGLAFGISTLFRSAEIKITPKQDSKTLNETFTAKKDLTGPGLGFQVVTVSKDVEKSVDPKDVTTEQKVERKARGTIVIYNNFGPEPQKLVATTRFETPEGLIYRIIEGVTVPGKVGNTPGSVEATVEADKVGPTYNVGLKDFTIPGLKSDAAKYKEMYGRSKTEMTGGFSGMQKIVTKDALAKAEVEMEETLKNSLSKDVISQIPSDFVLYTNSLSFKFEPATSATSASGTTVIRKRGTTNAIIFDKSVLTKAILAKVFPDAEENLIKITNLGELDFALATSSSSGSSLITFTMRGQANLEWVFDGNKLKTDLLGLSKIGANSVLAGYPSIKEAWITTKPFWNQKIPTDPKKVTLVNTVDEMSARDGSPNGI